MYPKIKYSILISIIIISVKICLFLDGVNNYNTIDIQSSRGIYNIFTFIRKNKRSERIIIFINIHFLFIFIQPFCYWLTKTPRTVAISIYIVSSIICFIFVKNRRVFVRYIIKYVTAMKCECVLNYNVFIVLL